MTDVSTPACLRVFVYGTLKSDQPQHHWLCGKVNRIEPAEMLGQLYHLPSGYPTLSIPPAHVLAVGTHDAAADVATQECTPPGDLTRQEQGEFEPIAGQVLYLDDMAQSLARLDAYEGFHPGRPSLYHRVLAPLHGNHGLCAWVYATPPEPLPAGAVRVRGSWPAGLL